MSTPDSMLDDVRMIVAETLTVDPDEVLPESHWVCDLDGESLDLLDLTFRLDRRFGVKIHLPAVSPTDLHLDQRGYLTRETLDRLGARFPFLELDSWEARPFTTPLDLITIGGIAGLVRASLAGSAARSAM